MRSHTIILADPGYGGPSLAYNISSTISDKVLWFSSENPKVAENIAKSYGKRIRLDVINSRRINIANLNEINIQLSRYLETVRDVPAICLTLVSELILIHGLEKVYLFLSNLINKVEAKRGTVISLVIRGAQQRRDEILISRLFANVFTLHGEYENEVRKFVLESDGPINDRFLFELQSEGYRIDLPPDVEKFIKGL
ncbi:hypothetical protein [Geoglobus acetivorans]|uniref:KaiC-like domain-containing protein n=1 Tax=Geoglobus acetivorans TaxID=565033 RepID=A0A0A7GCP2_GEOAI|nr:hypothetical protein GACE_0581 [Geoglobus acetivorans]